MLTCPRDGAALTRSEFRGVPYALCPACAGLWFTREALAAPALAGAASGGGGGNDSAPATPSAQLVPTDGPPRLCAACRDTPLAARWLAGAEIDACPDCGGVWLDAGEFDRVQAAYRRWREGTPWWWAAEHPLPGSDRPDPTPSSTAPVAAAAAFDAAVRVAGAVLELGLGALLGGAGGHGGGTRGGGGSFGGGGGFAGGGGGRSF